LLESLPVVADRHSQGQEFLQRFGGGLKTDGNLPRSNGNANRQPLELLAQQGRRRFHQDLRLPQAGLAQPFQILGKTVLAPPFVMRLFPCGQTPQVPQDGVTPGKTASADLPRNARSQNLLSPAPPDPQCLFQDGAVHPRLGKSAKLFGYFF
jgi:hypothetical protein